MSVTNGSRIGLVLGTQISARRAPALARHAEELGFDEFWIAEDLFLVQRVSEEILPRLREASVPVPRTRRRSARAGELHV